MQKILLSIKDFMDAPVFVLIILISLFELFVDRPALKNEGLIKDANIITFISILWIVMDVAMIIINYTAR